MSARTPVALSVHDDVAMVDVPESRGWIRELRTDAFGEPSAVVVWEHHNGVRALIPLRKLAPLASESVER